MKYIIALIIIILISIFFLSKIEVDNRECTRSHQEEYYSTKGTSLWMVTKNAGFIAMNGTEIKIVCDEYKLPITPKGDK